MTEKGAFDLYDESLSCCPDCGFPLLTGFNDGESDYFLCEECGIALRVRGKA